MSKFITALTIALSMLIAYAPANAAGNRYDLPRSYKSEISPAKAYLLTHFDRDNRNGRYENSYGHGDSHNAMIIDVRSIEEYVGGHPPGAYSIPYPHIYNRQHDSAKGDYIPQAPEDFVAAVNAMDLPKDTLIITMCRTGYRSVLAGNLLADAGYTNVRNMWEGFKGDAKLALDGVSKLDLNNDGVVDDNNPYSGDLDGWANYQELPVSKRLKNDHLYGPYMSMYYNVTGER
jgi:rhodanese-related sulfurtransferase